MLENALPALLLLLLMVALALGLHRFRRHLPGHTGHGGPTLKLLSSLPLGPQQRVVTVQLVQGSERICLVLGVAAGSVQTLHTLNLPAETAPSAQTTAIGGGFSARLAQLMKTPHAPR